MQKFLRTLMLAATMMLPFASQAQSCDPISTFPVTYGFEASEGFTTTVTGAAACTTNVFGPCWRNEATSGTATTANRIWHIYGGTTTSQIHSGTQSLILPDKGSSSALHTTMLTFPAMNFTNPGGYVVSFWIYRNGTGTSTPEGFKIYASSTDTIGPDAVELGHYSRHRTMAYPSIESATGWYQYETAPITMTGTVYIIFEGQSYYSSSTYIDDVVIDEAPTCIKVSNLAVDAATANSMTLSWTDAHNTGATYTVYNGTDVVATGITGTTYTVTGLEGNTLYTFDVEANCSATDASALVSVTGRTSCPETVALPYVEEFNGYTGFQSYPYYGPAVLPACWIYYSNGTNTDETTGTSAYYGGVACYNGTSYGSMVSNNPYLYMPIQLTGSAVTSSTYLGYATARGNVRYAVMPAFAEALSGLQISFDYKMSTAYSATGAAAVLELGYVTGDTSTFVSMQSWQAVSTTQHVVDFNLSTLAAEAPAGARLAFKFSGVHNGTSTSSYSNVACGIDNIHVETLPSCARVTNLTVAGVTSSTITLNWVDAINSGATYTVYNMADTSVVASGINDTTYTVATLDANTQYTFAVVANCSATDASAETTVSGRTACASETMPWSENFDTWESKSVCWSFLSGAYNGGNGTPTTSTSAWALNTSYGSYITISGKALTMNIYSTNRYWAVTPNISISSDNAMLSVDVAVAAWSAETPNYDANDTLAFAISTDGGNTFANLRVLDNTELNALNGTYTTLYIPVLNHNGQDVRFAIFGGSSASGGDNRIAIDNVTVGEAPACVPVANLTASGVTAHEATLTWNGNASSYAVYDMADSTLIQYVSDTTVDLTTLLSDHPYTIGVASVCGSDESAIMTVNFRTLISCPVPTNLAATLTPGDGTVATLTWNAGGEETAWQVCLNGDETNLIDVYDSTLDLTGLTPETAYTAKVRAICATDDMSAWSSIITFTPTNAYMITVNDGTTTNSYVPIYGLWVDDITKSQFVIPASDLTALQYGNITKLTFYASNANVNWGAATFDVYLTETSDATVSALADYTTMTQVYAGSLSIVDNAMEVTFTTPYTYMGGNLMVGFLQTVSGTYSSCNWYGVSATGASMGGYGSSISQRDFLPKTTINYTPGVEPDCLPVTGLTVSNITADGATLSWTGTADSYTIVNRADNMAEATVTGNTYSFTTLNPMTQYTFGVVANCGTLSSDTVNVTFTTACSAVTLPYTETFESTSATRNCWTFDAVGNVGGSYGMGFVTIEGRDVLRFSSYSNASDYNQYGYSPLMNVSADAVNLGVSVVYATYGSSDVLNFGYITATDTVWDPTNYTTTGSSDFQTFTAVIPATATQLAVHYYGDYSFYAWIDTVSVNEMAADFCYAVTDLAVDSATATSIFLSWTDTLNGGATYSIYGADGSVIATNVATTNYEVTGLTASTSYTFGVAANCSATSSSTMATISAMTDCIGGSCLVEINGVDSYGDGWNGNAINVMQSGNLIATFTLETGSTNSAHYNVCSGAPVTFTWVAGSYPGEASFEIKDGSGMVVYTGTGSTSMTTGDTLVTINNACPSCLPASNLTVDSADMTSITISWTGTAASYDVYNGTTFVANVTTNSYTFTGLTAATNYTFGVMAICSATDSSALATINASTTCAVINTFPYTQDFAAMPACWNTIDADGDGFNWELISGAMHSASYDNTYGALTPDNWLVTPQFQLAAGTNYEVTWNADPQDASWPSEHYGLYVTTTTADTAAFTLIQDWTLTAAGHVPVIDLSAYAGQTIYLAFRHWNCTDWFRVAIDNFQLREQAGANQVTVTLTQNNPMYGSVAGGGIYTIGDSVTVTATAAANYHFSMWADTTGATVSTANPYTFVAATDITLQAVFAEGAAPTNDTLTVIFQVADSTMGTTIPAPGTYQYGSTENVSFGSQANPGYRFLMWEMTVDGETDTLDAQYANGYYFPASAFLTDGNNTVIMKAYFEAGNPDSTTITYAVNDATMGTITPAPGTYTIYVGNSIDAEATANAGYELTAWVFDIYLNGSLYSSDTITSDDPDFDNPMVFGTLPQSFADYGATITVTAVFAPATVTTYTVIVRTSNGEMGNVTPAGINTVNAGESFTVTATPNEGYHFVNWTTGTDVVSTANPYTFTVTENINLIANFEANDSTLTYYEVSVTSANTEMGTVSSDVAVGQVAEGTVITVTATANEGYRFVNWVTDGGAVVSTENPYTFTVTENVNLVAVFERIDGIDDVEANDYKVYSIDNRIVVKGVENMSVYLFDVTGRTVKSVAKAAETVEFTVPSAGVYLVKAGMAPAKRVVVVR